MEPRTQINRRESTNLTTTNDGSEAVPAPGFDEIQESTRATSYSFEAVPSSPRISPVHAEGTSAKPDNGLLDSSAEDSSRPQAGIAQSFYTLRCCSFEPLISYSCQKLAISSSKLGRWFGRFTQNVKNLCKDSYSMLAQAPLWGHPSEIPQTPSPISEHTEQSPPEVPRDERSLVRQWVEEECPPETLQGAKRRDQQRRAVLRQITTAFDRESSVPPPGRIRRPSPQPGPEQPRPIRRRAFTLPQDPTSLPIPIPKAFRRFDDVERDPPSHNPSKLELSEDDNLPTSD